MLNVNDKKQKHKTSTFTVNEILFQFACAVKQKKYIKK